MNVLVSVIIPVYNVEFFLGKCIDSILMQTYENIEVILIDDGSTDSSGKICDEYAARDRRIIPLHRQNEGVAAARSFGLKMSKGEFVTFIDSDDYVAADYIEKLLTPLALGDYDVSVCQAFTMRAGRIGHDRHPVVGKFHNGEITKLLNDNYLYDKGARTSGMPLYIWGKMYKRSIIQECIDAGKGLWYGEDEIIVFKVMYNIKHLYISDEYLYYYVQHEGQTIRRYDSSIWDAHIACWKRYEEIDTECYLKKQFPLRIWQIINQDINRRILPNAKNFQQFRHDLNEMYEKSYMAGFFRNNVFLHLDYKEDIKFILLKLHLIFVYYFIVKKK